MNLDDQVINEIGDRLLDNDLFLNHLSKKLVPLIRKEQLIQMKSGKLTNKVKQSKIVTVSIRDAYLANQDLKNVVEMKIRVPQQMRFFSMLSDFPTGWVPYKCILEFCNEIQSNILITPSTKGRWAVIASLYSRLGLQDSDEVDEYGFTLFRIKTCYRKYQKNRNLFLYIDNYQTILEGQ